MKNIFSVQYSSIKYLRTNAGAASRPIKLIAIHGNQVSVPTLLRVVLQAIGDLWRDSIWHIVDGGY